MRRYETTYILRPNLGEALFNEIIERTNEIIGADGGSIIDLDRWGLKKLAYEIKKETQGYYVYMDYAAPASAVKEMERIFRLDDRLLRFLTIKLADAIDAETIEKEKELIAAKAAAPEADENEEQAEEKTEEKTKESAENNE